MPRSGGTMTMTGSSFVSGTTISSTAMNAKMDDIESEITNSVAVDGQSTMSAALDMGDNRITDVADPTALADAVSAEVVMTQGVSYYVDSGDVDTYAITMAPAVTELTAGQRVSVKIGSGHDNTGASTLNCNALGAVDIKKIGGSGKTALVADDLIEDVIYEFVYDGTDWVLQTNNFTIAEVQSLIDTAIAAAKSALYPVGSYYFNENNATNPGTLLGFGTWVAVAGRMLIGTGDGVSQLTITGISGANDTVEIASSYQLALGTLVTFYENGGSVPGLTDSTSYYVAASPSANNYKLATNVANAQRGSYVDISAGLTGSPYLETEAPTWTLGQEGGWNKRIIRDEDYKHQHQHTDTSTDVDTDSTGFRITNDESDAIVSDGTSTLFDVMPPYKVVYMWRRSA